MFDKCSYRNFDIRRKDGIMYEFYAQFLINTYFFHFDKCCYRKLVAIFKPKLCRNYYKFINYKLLFLINTREL